MAPRRSSPDQRVGEVLREEREHQGRSQESLAHDAGITTGTLGRIERGDADASWSTVTRIAEGLDLSMEELARRIEAKRR